MHARAILIICIFALGFQSANAKNGVLYSTPVKEGYLNTRFSKIQVKEDIDMMLQTMKKAHPAFYHSFTQTQLQKTVDSLYLAMPDSLGVYDAVIAFSCITSKFNEGHLGLVWNTEIFSFFHTYPERFPYSIMRITDGAFIIRKDLTAKPELEITDSITQINGVAVCDLVKKFNNCFGGIKEWKAATIKYQLDYLLFINNIRSPFTIKAIHNGNPVTISAVGVAKNQKSSSENKKTNSAYSFSLLDNGTAYIDFFSMGGDYKAFKDSLANTFAEIKQEGAHKLIVDLRKNGGGSSMFGDHLLTYVTKKPYRMAGASEMKISKPVKQNLRNSGLPIVTKCLSYLVPTGIKIKSNDKAKARKPAEQFFDGKVCFLISNNTFSSANMLANAIQDFDLAPLIGENTGEPCNDYGDMVDFMLPNTQLVARTPFKHFTRANGDKNDSNPVIPTYIVLPTMDDIKSNKDAVLEYAEKFLEKQ